jgi:3-oxoacyl-ACP reductase-like protein
MSVFGDILSKIFRHPKAQAAPAAPPSQAAPATAPAAAAPAAAATTEAPAVDVAAVLEVMAKDYGQPSNWRESIVDLLKLLSIDSSLANRKALAAELGYTGDTDDSATMNVWLHKAVMRKLAENGGIVPDSLR